VLGKAKQKILDIDITSSPSTSLVKEVRAPENHRNKAENVSHMDQLKEVQSIGTLLFIIYCKQFFRNNEKS
jgi:hypothetical protein